MIQYRYLQVPVHTVHTSNLMIHSCDVNKLNACLDPGPFSRVRTRAEGQVELSHS